MIKHYFKVAYRNFMKHKSFSVLNVTGLSLGMAAAILLLLWVQNQLSVDQFHKRKDTIYKVYTQENSAGQVQSLPLTPQLLAQTLQNNFPEIQNTARIQETGKLLVYADKKIKASGSFTDPSFLDIFSFPLLQGASQSVLNDPHSIVITESLAKTIFGTENPVNKIIRIDNSEDRKVTGILKDLPNNTQFKFDFLLPWDRSAGMENGAWANNNTNTFVELQPLADINAVNNKISNVIQDQGDHVQKTKLFLYPLSKLWLHAHFENGKPAGGGIDVVRLLCILAAIILLIACINFMNLSTARSEKRAKEVGVRKVMGAGRNSLVRQFIGEAIFMACIAGAIALIIAELVLPSFNTLTGKQLRIEYQSPLFWLSFAGFILFTGILAGSYPAFYLSSFKPVKVLKGILVNGNAFLTPRKVLVVFQFIFAIVLVNFTILLQKQVTYLQNREPGFVKEKLVFQPFTPDLQKNYPVLRTELLQSGAVLSVSRSNTPITSGGVQVDSFTWMGKDPADKVSFAQFTTQKDFIKTTGVTLLAGRDIDLTSFPADTASCLVNETAMKLMGFTDPVGKILTGGGISLTIVGVVKDYVTGSPQQAIEPVIISGSNGGDFINIRLADTHSFAANINTIGSTLKKYNPNFLTEYQFADDEYARKMRGLTLTATLTNIFSAIAIFISCLGLFGLVVYTAENKTREIGIRKILGAGIMAITTLLAKDFMKLILLAIVIATPLAWLLMNSFLRPVHYRTGLSWWILAASATIALLITIGIISFQSIKTAKENPAKSLRTE